MSIFSSQLGGGDKKPTGKDSKDTSKNTADDQANETEYVPPSFLTSNEFEPIEQAPERIHDGEVIPSGTPLNADEATAEETLEQAALLGGAGLDAPTPEPAAPKAPSGSATANPASAPSPSVATASAAQRKRVDEPEAKASSTTSPGQAASSPTTPADVAPTRPTPPKPPVANSPVAYAPAPPPAPPTKKTSSSAPSQTPPTDPVAPSNAPSAQATSKTEAEGATAPTPSADAAPTDSAAAIDASATTPIAQPAPEPDTQEKPPADKPGEPVEPTASPAQAGAPSTPAAASAPAPEPQAVKPAPVTPPTPEPLAPPAASPEPNAAPVTVLPLSPNLTAAAINGPVAIIGANPIGLYLAGMLAQDKKDVRALGRPKRPHAPSDAPLSIANPGADAFEVAGDDLAISDSAEAALDGANVILVTAPTPQTESAAALIKRHAPKDAVIISIQTGVRSLNDLRAALPDHDVRAAVAEFSVAWNEHGLQVNRRDDGVIWIDDTDGTLAQAITTPAVTFLPTPDISNLQWARLVFDLNEALNALSGETYHAQLRDKDWRALLAESIEEALIVLEANGIKVDGLGRHGLKKYLNALRGPGMLFNMSIKKWLGVDPEAYATMLDDLVGGLPTEIQDLQGEIVALGQKAGVPTPYSMVIHDWVQETSDSPHAPPRVVPARLRARLKPVIEDSQAEM